MSDTPWDLDFGGTTTEAADLDNAATPDGWYRVRLASVKDDNDNGAKILEFQIVHGTLTNKKFREWLHNPKFAGTTGAADFAKKKANCYATRFGLVDASVNGKTAQRAFSEAIGKEMVVKLTTKPGKDGGKSFQGLDFDCYPAGHPSLKADVYPLVGLVAPPEAPKGGADKPAAAAASDAKTPVTSAKSTAEMAAMVW